MKEIYKRTNMILDVWFSGVVTNIDDKSCTHKLLVEAVREFPVIYDKIKSGLNQNNQL